MGLLAEQLLVDCPSSRLEAVLRTRPLDWMAPLLRLAGDEGEAAGLSLLGRPRAGRAAGRRGHRLEAGESAGEAGDLLVPLHWRTTAYAALFAEFEGWLRVRALDDHTVLSIEGRFLPKRGAPRTGVAALAARRAAESATRSLLSHLRASVEESAFPR
ncbi:MAG: hypothetical protein ACT4PX_00630, partial [Actinomycetota bacterium]